MQQRQSIRDIHPNEDVLSVFLLGAASLQQSRNGPYWRLELRDATGSVDAKIWSPLSTSFTDLAPGQMAEISAKAAMFRDQLQLTVDSLRVLTGEERNALPMGDFMPSSPRPPADMLADAEALCRAELTHAPWLRFALSVLEDPSIRARLLVAPAAKSVHHAYVGGLLEHMLSVAGLCMRMADHYPDLDRQTLLAGALLHDIGKLDEMSGGLVNDYTDAGRFLGHIVQGLIMLEPFLLQSGLEPQLALHFRHLIASHHGQMDFGAPREPATAEAFALHYADNVDAKIAQWRSLFPSDTEDNLATGSASLSPTVSSLSSVNAEESTASIEADILWSPWQNLLGRSLCRPARTPVTPAGAALPHKGEAKAKKTTHQGRASAHKNEETEEPAPAISEHAVPQKSAPGVSTLTNSLAESVENASPVKTVASTESIAPEAIMPEFSTPAKAKPTLPSVGPELSPALRKDRQCSLL